ncbi:MAG: hypothetical protein CSA84_03665 [Actinomycetales bacterium]|nr:MAG: hypothetical protein CSA84_03665 [Actinomycetales bacterium]
MAVPASAGQRAPKRCSGRWRPESARAETEKLLRAAGCEVTSVSHRSPALGVFPAGHGRQALKTAAPDSEARQFGGTPKYPAGWFRSVTGGERPQCCLARGGLGVVSIVGAPSAMAAIVRMRPGGSGRF